MILYLWSFLVCQLVQISVSQYEEQISHGLAASENQFPFHAVITDSKDQVTCGGTFISRRHVLTAAHCVQVRSKSDIKVHGAMISGQDPKRISVNVAKVYVHDTFDADNFIDDIAIITLSSDVEDSEGRKIQAMKLPHQDEEYQVNSYGLICGFGETQDGNMSKSLLFARERIVEPSSCSLYSHFRPNLMMCAFNTYSESCRGDSGGGLIVKQRLVGILIFGSEYACGSHQPTSYIKVSSYINWIRSVTRDSETRVPTSLVTPSWWTTPAPSTESTTPSSYWPDQSSYWPRQPPRYDPQPPRIPTPVTTSDKPPTSRPTRARLTRRPSTTESTTPSTTSTTTTTRAPPRAITDKPTRRLRTRPTQIYPSTTPDQPEVVTEAPPTNVKTDLPFTQAADPRLGSFRGWARNCNGNKRWGWTTTNPVTTYVYDCTCVYEVRYERGNKEITQAEPFTSCQKNAKGLVEDEATRTTTVYRDPNDRKKLGRYRGKFRSCKGTIKTRGSHVTRQCICEYTEKYDRGNYVFHKEEPYDEFCANAQPLNH